MQSTRESSLSFVTLLKSCAKSKDLHKGSLIHADLLARTDLLEKCPYVGSSLVSMYAKCGALAKSRAVFDKIQVRNVVCWNALIGGYAHQGQGEQALLLFDAMKQDGCSPDAITYGCALKACASTKNAEVGKQIHGEIVMNGEVFGEDVSLGNALVDMYVKCGLLDLAEKAFDELRAPRRTACFNVLVSGYARNGRGEKALRCFDRLKEEGCSPDVVTYICALKACASARDVEKGRSIHDEIVRRGSYGKDIMLGSALMNMYAKCGALAKAQRVFDELAVRNVVCWNILVAGYSEHGRGEEALACSERMRRDGVSPNAITYLCILKACAIAGDVERGKRAHGEIARKRLLLGGNPPLGTALVAMYAKCGALERAEELFDALPLRNVASWNALISAYAQQGRGEGALQCFERMQKGEGLAPNRVTYICALKACAGIGNMIRGEEIRESVLKGGDLATDVVVGTALLDMYAKCGALEKAREAFDELPVRNVVCWNALISGYALHGRGEEALQAFDLMEKGGSFAPDEATYVCALKACACAGALNRGEQIHGEIRRRRLLLGGAGASLATALVDMYAKCGALARAEEALDEVPVRNAACWNALLAGYSQEARCEAAFACLRRMRSEGFAPNDVSHVCILKACSSAGEVGKGAEIHEALSSGRGPSPANDVVLATALIDMYAKCGALDKAEQAFHELSAAKNRVCWNALIAGYAQHGHGEKALDLVERMRNSGLSPDDVTYICILKACAAAGDLDEGKRAHEEIAAARRNPSGRIIANVSLVVALIDMYCRCGALARAEQVFSGEAPVRHAAIWNVLMSGYSRLEKSEEVLGRFDQMRVEGVPPDPATFGYAVRACAAAGAVRRGRQIHEQILREQLIIEKQSSLGTSLVDMYAKFGEMEKAEEVFAGLVGADIGGAAACWTALIAGYVQQDRGEEALGCLERMQADGSAPDAFALSCILKACANVGAVSRGRQIHEELIVRNRLLEEDDVVLGTALLDMYAKCGELEQAERVFAELPSRSLVCWNALLAGYAQRGLGDETLDRFERMQELGFAPDSSTLVCVLNACSHAGLVEHGGSCFADMAARYGLVPGLDHHTCLVDLFGRAGQVDKALEVVAKIPCSGNLPIWLALLGSCRNWQNVETARLAFQQAIQLDAASSAPYALMIGIYSAVGLTAEAEQIEAMRARNAG